MSAVPRRVHRRVVTFLAAALLLAAACGVERPRGVELTVFAAASLRDVLGALEAPFTAASGASLVFNFAGSNVLARQIEHADGADVYLAANPRWMDHLERVGRLVPGSRRPFLSNHLVVVVQRRSALALAAPADLVTVPYRFLSLADPEAVPAGIYARRFLEQARFDGVDLWSQLGRRVAPAPDVRAALHLVEARDDVVGIVYRTDAAASSQVRIAFPVPPPLEPPIRYHAAVIRGGPNADTAARFLAFLAGDTASAVFVAHGFEPVAEAGNG